MAPFYKKSKLAVRRQGRLPFPWASCDCGIIARFLFYQPFRIRFMQQRPSAAPSAAFNLLLAAVLGFMGLFDLVVGARGDGAGVFMTGLAMTIYAALLLRDALHIKKTGQPAMSRASMNKIGLACLALYVFGVLVKRVPELAQFFG
jgi:hypothetical protein